MLSVILLVITKRLWLEYLHQTVSKILSDANILFELIFVDDVSKDKTRKMIQEVSVKDMRIKSLHFFRNFGKESAIIAGLAEASGDYCEVIDCDSKHSPEKIVEM